MRMEGWREGGRESKGFSLSLESRDGPITRVAAPAGDRD